MLRGTKTDDSSPTTVTALLDERPDIMRLPHAFAETDVANCNGKPSSAGRPASFASYKAAGRQSAPARRPSHGPSAYEIWGQCLAERSNMSLSATAAEFVPMAASILNTSALEFVPEPAPKKSRRRPTKRASRASASPTSRVNWNDDELIVKWDWWRTLRTAAQPAF